MSGECAAGEHEHCYTVWCGCQCHERRARLKRQERIARDLLAIQLAAGVTGKVIEDPVTDEQQAALVARCKAALEAIRG